MAGTAEEHRERAELRARKSASGIGAAVTRSESEGGGHAWQCIVTDGRQWHYLRVIGTGVGPFPDIYPEGIERGIEQLAGTLPTEGRLQYLLDMNPLHMDVDGNVGD